MNMASISRIEFHQFDVSDSASPTIDKVVRVVHGVPVLYYSDGRMWEEASLYLVARATEAAESSPDPDLQSVWSDAWHLRAYLAFCEEKSIDPMSSGPRRLDKPTQLFRARLLLQRDGKAVHEDGTLAKRLAASTVSNRIRAVAKFFVWTIGEGTFSFESVPCNVRQVTVHVRAASGLSRPIRVHSTDLAIRYRRAERNTVEGGLTPVSIAMRDAIIAEARLHSSLEFSLMLETGFRSGPRLQTICDLKLSTLQTAIRRKEEGLWLVRVGPRHGVATKFGVNYEVQMPTDLLERLLEYAESTRRLLRVAKADPAIRDLVFLTRFGERYNRRGSDESASVAQDMARLRKAARGRLDLSGFYFHCSRATFGTSIVQAGLKARVPIDRILARLKALMGHADARTSLRYVQFVETEAQDEAIEAEMCK